MVIGTRSTRALVASPLLAALLILTGSCQGTDEDPSLNQRLCAGGYDPTTGRSMSFGTAGVAKQINAFLDTSTSLVKAAGEIDTEMRTTCLAMGTQLMIPAAELMPAAGSMDTATQAACRRVSQEIRTVIETNVPVGAKLSVVFEPPACSAEISVMRSCLETCEDVTIMETEVVCKPGKLSGTCGATCSGSCTGSCGATCTGKCSGTCTGQCMGTCNGKCNGTCMAMDASGNCAGACQGTCEGTCDATCMGSCMGNCTASCSGSCMGTCRGECNVMWVAPKCEEIVYTRMETQCKQTCDTQTRASAMCTPGMLKAEFSLGIGAVQKAKVDLVLATLRTHLPAIIKLGVRTTDVIGTSAEAYYTALSGLISSASQVTVQAGACIATAAGVISSVVLPQLSVSVEFSASISLSAAAEGKASAMAGM